MKYSFLKKDRKKSLILFFAGWSMDTTPFTGLSQLDCDSVVVYDYTDLSLEKNILDGYANVFVFAWSFGVYAAAYWLQKENVRPTMAVAINGTLSPIDDEQGIPVDVFNGTLENLSEQSLQKFYRRMCQSTEQYSAFMSVRPERNLESLRNELIAIRDLSAQRPEVFKGWTKAYIADDDRIFPAANQVKAWNTAGVAFTHLQSAHLPKDITALIAANLVDKRLVKQHFEKFLPTYDANAVCQSRIADTLFQKWEKAGFAQGKKIYELGCGTGMFTKTYVPHLQPKNLLLNDIAEIPSQYFDNLECPYTFTHDDAEYAVRNEKFDYIVSASAVQWFENIPAFLQRTKGNLADKGMLVFSSFGKSNLKELRVLTGSSLHYLSLAEWEEALRENGYEIIELSEEEIVLPFASPLELIKSLKYTGVNGVKTISVLTKTKVQNLKNELPAKDGIYALTYNPIYIIARLK